MASLLSLPTELLLHILDCVPRYIEGYNDHGKGSFYHLSLTCKRLHELVIPMLYRDVVFGPSNFGSMQRMPDFVHAIQASEAHASMVRSYALKQVAFPTKRPSGVHDRATYEAFLERVCENTRQAAKAAMIQRAFQPIDEDTTYYEVYPRLISTLYLPNLEELLVSGHFDWSDPFDDISKVFQEASSDEERAKLDIWPKLRKVVIEGTGDNFPDNTLPLAVFARVPQVECIVASDLGDQEDDGEEPLWHIRPSSSGLQRLVLGPNCQLTNRNMEELLRAPKALKEFRYNRGHFDDYIDFSYIDFSTAALERALRQQSHSLEHLSLSHTYSEYSRDYDTDQIQPINLSYLHALRVLEISPLFVFGDLGLPLYEPGVPQYRQPVSTTLTELLDTTAAATKRNLVDMLPKSLQVLRFSRCGRDLGVSLCLGRCLQELASCIKQQQQPQRCRRQEQGQGQGQGQDSAEEDDGSSGGQFFGNLRTVELHLQFRCADIQWDALLPGLEALRSVGVEAGVFDGGRLSFDQIRDGPRAAKRLVEPGESCFLESTSRSITKEVLLDIRLTK